MAFPFTSAARGAGIAGLLFFTVFWCSITGVFAGELAHSVYRSHSG